MTTYSGDGLIVSTPVGSTARGQPVRRRAGSRGRTLQAFVITPVCPHTLSNCPLVDDAAREYVMRVLDGSPGVTPALDGQIATAGRSGDSVVVRCKWGHAFQLADSWAQFKQHAAPQARLVGPAPLRAAAR
ncbi:MAG: hypothetical protein U0992_08445 [Planctomycetaceae bacterium]